VTSADDEVPMRVRNLFVDVAIGDWVVLPTTGERITDIIPHLGFRAPSLIRG
jgi:hypothetical protein